MCTWKVNFPHSFNSNISDFFVSQKLIQQLRATVQDQQKQICQLLSINAETKQKSQELEQRMAATEQLHSNEIQLLKSYISNLEERFLAINI